MSEFFNETELISHNQPRLKLGDAVETRCIFFDISNVFDKVWYGDLLSRLTQNCITVNFIYGLNSNPKLFADGTPILSAV